MDEIEKIFLESSVESSPLAIHILRFPGIKKEYPFNVNDFLKALSESWEEPPPFFLTSAVKRTGLKQLLGFINHLNTTFESHKLPGT